MPSPFSHDGTRFFADGTLSYTQYEEIYHDTKDIFYSSSSTRGDVDDREQDTYTVSFSAGYVFDLGGISYTPTFGFNYETVDYTQRRTYPYGSSSTARYDLDLDEYTAGFFWDNDFIFGDHWSLKIGNRFDKVDLTLEDMTPAIVEADDTMWSWVVAPSYHFNPSANLYFSISQNYWFPSPQYYFWAQSYGHPENRPEDLDPEKMTTYEIGYKHRVSQAVNLALTVYYMETEDKFSGFYEGSSYYGQKNTGDAETVGVEVEIDGRPLEWLGYRLMGSYIDAEWSSGMARVYSHPDNVRVLADLDGYQVNGIPEFNGRAGLDFYPVENVKASLDANYWGDYYLDYLNRVEYSSRTTFDAYVAYTRDRFKFWILGKNIFDKEIERPLNSDGELTEPGGKPINSYYVLDGAYVEAGMSIAF